MTLELYQVDAFTDELFRGNPAAVVPLPDWPSDACLQAIASENNLSETAFYTSDDTGFHIRWFTPGREVRLCGHATLAASHVILAEKQHRASELVFQSLNGELRVRLEDGRYLLDFPAEAPSAGGVDPRVLERLRQHTGSVPLASARASKELLLLDSETAVRDFDGHFADLDCVAEGVILTAHSEREATDFVSRFFGGPSLGITEDPVTGSAHCILAPFWAERLGRNDLQAEQLSRRRGRIECRVRGGRVQLLGQAVTYLRGRISIQ